MRSKLYDAYCEASLAKRRDEGALPASTAPGRAHDYVTFGPQQQPVLLISCASTSRLKRPPICLQHLTIEFGIRFRVRTPAEVIEEDFVVISLRDSDNSLAETFCLVAEALLSALPETPSSSDIDAAIRDLIEVVRGMSLPSARALIGLWAELWLMSVSSNPHAAVAAWHGRSMDRFDFSFASHFVEVKATLQEERSHEFSYEQLRRSEVPIRVLSLRIRHSQKGKSINDLLATLQSGLPPELRAKLIKNVFSAMGSTASEASEIRFDDTFAEANLRVIEADRLPVVEIPDRSPISSIRFRIHLGDSSLSGHLKKVAARMALEFS